MFCRHVGESRRSRYGSAGLEPRRSVGIDCDGTEPDIDSCRVVTPRCGYSDVSISCMSGKNERRTYSAYTGII